jgi:hypothetical protein
MNAALRIFSWGLFISFVGTLPLGTLNVAAMQIAIQEGVTNALWFTLGILLVEMAYVRISLVGIDWIRRRKRLLKWMEWITFLFILALAIGSFAAAMKSPGTKNIMLQNQAHRFFLGLIMSAINPVQIPFWFGWSSILFGKNILKPSGLHFNFYMAGIGIGTFLGTCLFIFSGTYLFEHISNADRYINWAIGSVFAVTAIIQLIKMLRHKDAVEKIREWSEEMKEE